MQKLGCAAATDFCQGRDQLYVTPFIFRFASLLSDFQFSTLHFLVLTTNAAPTPPTAPNIPHSRRINRPSPWAALPLIPHFLQWKQILIKMMKSSLLPSRRPAESNSNSNRSSRLRPCQLSSPTTPTTIALCLRLRRCTHHPISLELLKWHTRRPSPRLASELPLRVATVGVARFGAAASINPRTDAARIVSDSRKNAFSRP